MADAKIEDLTALTAPATADVLAIVDDPAGSPATKKITFESLTKRHQVIPCVLEVPQGTVAYPDVHAMTTTTSKKITGIVLPDNAATSTLNFKCIIPEDLHATSAQLIRVRFITLDADTAHAVRLTVSTVGIAVNEDMDIGLTAETEFTAECADANDTMNEALINVDLTTDWASGDTVLGLLTRDPTDGTDDYAGDILIVGIELLLFTVGSA